MDVNAQKAGSNSQQFQVQNLTIGIDEKRVREICDEKFLITKKEFTEEAIRIANGRVKELENRLISKIKVENEGMELFMDPSFQLLLVEAQKSAAATERPADYDLLSELLIHRIKSGANRKIRTGINRAVEVVGEISDEALLGLTVAHSVHLFTPVSGDILQGFDALNNLFGKIIYGNLPMGNNWLDHLDLLDSIRISQFSKFNSIEHIYTHALDGYVRCGIKKDSDNYRKAIDILQKNGLVASGILVDHVLNPGYVRVNVLNEFSVNKLVFQKNGNPYDMIYLSSQQENAIKSLYTLYSDDDIIKKQVVKSFMDLWITYANLKKLKEWWESIPTAFVITSVGEVLAHANIQRCDSNLGYQLRSNYNG